MTVSRTDIERVLSEIIAYEEGKRFQALAVVPCVPENAKEPVDLTYDFFGQYDPEGFIRQLGDAVKQSPSLKGVSGGSLLQYDDTTTGLWSVQKTMKLVGIQSSASTSKKWYRAKKSNVNAKLFDRIDPIIGAAIEAQLKRQGTGAV